MLNPELDVVELGKEFRANGRVRVGRVLQFEAADQIYNCLHREVPWTLAFREAAGARTLPDQDFAALSEPEKEKLFTEIHAIAKTSFQFVYNSYMMVEAYKEGRNPELLLNAVSMKRSRGLTRTTSRHTRSFISISTSSMSSTIPSAIPPATNYSYRSQNSCRATSARQTSLLVWAATSLASCLSAVRKLSNKRG